MGLNPDIYTKVHKGLRKALFELSCCVSRTDGSSDEEIITLAKLFNQVMRYLEVHGKNEEFYELSLLKEKFPGSVEHAIDENKMIEKQIDALKRNFNNLVSSSLKERKLKAEVFYHLLNDFISMYLPHMLNKEFETAKLLQENRGYNEINQALRSFISNTSPQDMMMMLKFIIPALNRFERVELISGIKQNAPQPAYNAVMVLAQSLLTSEEYDYLIEVISSRDEKTSKVWEAVA